MKRLILCCDGTWNSPDQEHNNVPCPTNVVRLAYRVAKRDSRNVPQIIFYDQGVGTGNAVDRLSGGAFGSGLEDNVHDAYRFLASNYEHGDEIFLFGFSRGAFAARSIAGMIRKCGILKRESVARYINAIQLYRSDEHPDEPAPTQFRSSHSVCSGSGIPIKFLGVWDTVGSLGIPLRGLRWITRREHQFHDINLSGSVAVARHALAIDERRAPFEPTLWKHSAKAHDLKQVWFCGAHSNVGGGYPERGLSDIALQWMLDEAAAAGLALDAGAAAAYPLKPSPLDTLTSSKTGLYRLTKGLDRPIGLTPPDPTVENDPTAGSPDPSQSLHASVLQRWDAVPDYRPPQLRSYLLRIGDARGTQA